jgi:hypothetical protein
MAEFYARGFTQIQPLNPDSAIAFKSRFLDPATQRRYALLKTHPLLRLYALTFDELGAEVPRLNMRAVECMYDAACCFIDPLPPAGALPYASEPPSTICAHTRLDHGGHCPPGLHAAKVAIAQKYPTEFARTNTYVGQELNSKVYVSFDGTVECMRYFRQYMPLHMPQIEEAVLNTLQQCHFSQRRVHILDIGGGPGNLYCILAGLLHRALIPDLHFDISLVEPGNPFHEFLDVISHHVHHPRLRLRAKYNCRLDQLPDRMQTRDVDWFFVANAITPLVANAGNVPSAVDSFCHVIDETRRKHSEGTLTIAENTRSTDFPAFAENLRSRGMIPQISDRSCNAPWLGGCQFYVTGPRRLTSPRLKLSVVTLMEGATV